MYDVQQTSLTIQAIWTENHFGHLYSYSAWFDHLPLKKGSKDINSKDATSDHDNLELDLQEYN